MAGYWVFDEALDDPAERRVLFRIDRGENLPEIWRQWADTPQWEVSTEALYWVMEATSVTEVTEDQAREMFPGAIAAIEARPHAP